MLLQMSICPKIGLQNVSINSEKWAKLGTLNWTPYLFMIFIPMNTQVLIQKQEQHNGIWMRKMLMAK